MSSEEIRYFALDDDDADEFDELTGGYEEEEKGYRLEY